MNIEDIIRAWKADEEALEPHLPSSPVGHELSEQELEEVTGSAGSPAFCYVGCVPTTAQGTGVCGHEPHQPITN